MVHIELIRGDITTVARTPTDVEHATFVLFGDAALHHFEDALTALSS